MRRKHKTGLNKGLGNPTPSSHLKTRHNKSDDLIKIKANEFHLWNQLSKGDVALLVGKKALSLSWPPPKEVRNKLKYAYQNSNKCLYKVMLPQGIQNAEISWDKSHDFQKKDAVVSNDCSLFMVMDVWKRKIRIGEKSKLKPLPTPYTLITFIIFTFDDGKLWMFNKWKWNSKFKSSNNSH